MDEGHFSQIRGGPQKYVILFALRLHRIHYSTFKHEIKARGSHVSAKCTFFSDLLKSAPKNFFDPERDLATPENWVSKKWPKMANFWAIFQKLENMMSSMSILFNKSCLFV